MKPLARALLAAAAPLLLLPASAAGDGGDIDTPTEVAATAEAVWVVRLQSSAALGPPTHAPYRLERLDPHTLRPTQPSRGFARPLLLAAGPRTLWMAGGRGDVRVLGPGDRFRRAHVPRLGFGVGALAFSARFAWVLNGYQNRLYRIARRSGRRAPGWIRPSPRAQVAVAATSGGAWTLSVGERRGGRARGPGAITRVGEDGRMSAPRRICREPRDLVSAAGRVFVLCAGGGAGELMRLGAPRRAVRVGPLRSVGEVVAAPDGLWVASDHALTRIDPRTLAVEARLRLGTASPSSLAASRDGLVVALQRTASGRVCRIVPLSDRLGPCRVYVSPASSARG